MSAWGKGGNAGREEAKVGGGGLGQEGVLGPCTLVLTDCRGRVAGERWRGGGAGEGRGSSGQEGG